VNWRVNHEALNTPQDQRGQAVASPLPVRRAGEERALWQQARRILMMLAGEDDTRR
jgi:hypothetical protein